MMQLIDIDLLQDAVCGRCDDAEGGRWCVKCLFTSCKWADIMPSLQKMPEIKAGQQPKHGTWHPVKAVYGLTKWVCSLCGCDVPGGLDRNYCPNCGARMGGDINAAD